MFSELVILAPGLTGANGTGHVRVIQREIMTTFTTRLSRRAVLLGGASASISIGVSAAVATSANGAADTRAFAELKQPRPAADPSSTAIRTFSGHTDNVDSAALLPGGHTAFSCSSDGTFKLWDITTGEATRSFTGWGHAVACAPDGRTALVAGDGGINVFDLETGHGIRSIDNEYPVRALALARNGRTVLSGSDDHTLKLWDIGTGEQIRAFTGHEYSVRGVAISPDGRTALSGSWDMAISPLGDKTLKLWDIATGKEIHNFSGISDWIWAVAFSPDGRIALAGGDRVLKLWDVATGKVIRDLQIRGVHAVAFSPDGRRVLANDSEKVVLLEAATGRVIRTFTGHSRNISSLAFLPDGRTALSASWDHTLKLWNTDVSAFNNGDMEWPLLARLVTN